MRVGNRQRVMQVNPERPGASTWRAAPRPPGKKQASRGPGAAEHPPAHKAPAGARHPRHGPSQLLRPTTSTFCTRASAQAWDRGSLIAIHCCSPCSRGDKLYSTVAQGTRPGGCPQPSHLSPGASQLAPGARPLPEAPPAPAWHGHRSSAPHHAALRPLKTGGPTLPTWRT